MNPVPEVGTPEFYALANIQAKADKLGLWDQIRSIRVFQHDRFFFEGIVTMRNWLDNNPSFSKDIISSGGVHEQVFGIYQMELEDEVLHSYREIARPSLQVTFAQTAFGVYGDMDIDLSSPSMDVVGFFTHLFEVITPGPTDHKQLYKKLVKKGFFA